MNNTLKRLAEPGSRLYLVFLVLFAAATLFFKVYDLDMFILAMAEGGAILLLIIYTVIMRRRREKQLAAYIESVTYDTENAKNNTLMNFPLPIAVFHLADSRIVWGNEMFFDMCGKTGTRLDASIADTVPGFTGKWLLEGKTQYPGLLEVNGKKYQLHGNIIRSEHSDEQSAFMGITYWVDVTEYDSIRVEFENSRPVAGVIVIDNLDELTKNQPERIKNDLRDAVDDKLTQWADERKAILRRYDRDRYIFVLERRYLDALKEANFRTEVGPGVYDIHSARVPSVEEIKDALKKMLGKVQKEKLWVNPDCGLKTRGEEETAASLKNLVAAAKALRAEA